MLKLFALPCLQLENLPKRWEKKKQTHKTFNKGHLPNGLDSKPNETKKMSQCCEFSKLGSHFLGSLLHALAWYRHHGQMSAAPERSPEQPRDSRGDNSA